jgi:hypothetical protein
MEVESGNPNKAKGGIARAEALTADQRSNIARKAATERWNSQFPKATHTGSLKIGQIEIPCAVLQDGRRVLWQQGFLRAIGRTGRAAEKAVSDDIESTSLQLPLFLRADNLKPFITQELKEASTPIVFRPIISSRGGKSIGYTADLLPLVCQVFLDAADGRALRPNQQHIYERCKILIRGLTHVGIIALVDEATRYQEVRDRKALEAILDQYLRKELAAWAKRFPDEFYQEIFRLKHWSWAGMSGKRPAIVGRYTADLVYERLAPGILDELQRLNPRNEHGNRRAKHHQWLTEDVGHSTLAQHLYALISFMRISDSWEDFYRMVQRAFPKKNTTLLLPFVSEA